VAIYEDDQAQRNFNTYLAIKEHAVTLDQVKEAVETGEDLKTPAEAVEPKNKHRRNTMPELMKLMEDWSGYVPVSGRHTDAERASFINLLSNASKLIGFNSSHFKPLYMLI